ncbi:class I SAM-dependent methyltransferase [Marinivivus vitaminiproducens]|uniref:class I SAM-dependent methyltransferase n=1 Tax=Marinivivus vitaminiproducens TaxID=3035935 RepID=UPI00279F6AC2|nr:class I SAM-dependent methyltransferase [Geminicoccaceae bacterium SCSIO 64248]
MAECGYKCPSCASGVTWHFFRREGIPCFDAMVMNSRTAALEVPRGDLDLVLCRACGLVFNAAFDPERVPYDSNYEGTQAASPTFNRFHADLADDLIAACMPNGGHVVEIGCGQGEFLELLAEHGGVRGTGYDPAFRGQPTHPLVRIEPRLFGGTEALDDVDLVICKMTLEHVIDVAGLLGDLRRGLANRKSKVFFMIPDFGRIMEQRTFWDISYEHCTYFTPGSLARAFRRAGFAPLKLGQVYGGQYLTILAEPGDPDGNALALEEPVAETVARVEGFATLLSASVDDWRRRIMGWDREGRGLVIWGGGSKTVNFLSLLGDDAKPIAAIDINPRKHGTFLPGSGVGILSPTTLSDLHPGRILLMNPIYFAEVAADLKTLGVTAPLLDIETEGPARQRIMPAVHAA